jgi:hypothetical protein
MPIGEMIAALPKPSASCDASFAWPFHHPDSRVVAARNCDKPYILAQGNIAFLVLDRKTDDKG